MQRAGEQARFVRRLEHDGAGAVTEKHAGTTVRPVQYPGKISEPTTSAFR